MLVAASRRRHWPAAAGAVAEEHQWRQPGPEERRRLLERLATVPDEDNFAFFAKIRQRMDM